MKPRFDLRFGVWRCWMWTPKGFVAGFGRTVREAWQDFCCDPLLRGQR